MRIFDYMHLIVLRRKWRKNNPHNSTSLENPFNINKVFVGKETYGGLTVDNYGKDRKLYIGNYCSIATNVMFILDADHYTDHISTFPFKAKILNSGLEGVSKGDIVVDDDVWIGYGATILSGVHIGQGAIIAAGAVVTKDVPPYAIMGGVPAKVIKYRFDNSLVKELLQIDYCKLTKDMIMEHANDLYEELKDARQIEWMPKKATNNNIPEK